MDPTSAQNRPAGRVRELHVYYLLVGLYFFAFGMQFVMFPALVAFSLEATPAGVGLAQSALSAPMFCLLLFGGLLAERAKAGPTLAQLHLAFACASFTLSAIIAAGWLSYLVLIGYAVIVGGLAAFMMPVRDAALNGVIARDTERGRHTPIATAAATTTAVQIGAQIAGILVARDAGAAPAPFLALQAIALLIGAANRDPQRFPMPDRLDVARQPNRHVARPRQRRLRRLPSEHLGDGELGRIRPVAGLGSRRQGADKAARRDGAAVAVRQGDDRRQEARCPGPAVPPAGLCDGVERGERARRLHCRADHRRLRPLHRCDERGGARAAAGKAQS